MGTEVLRPHDVLADRFRFPPHHRRKNNNLTNIFVEKKPFNNNYNKKSSPRPDKKKPISLPRKKDDAIVNNNANYSQGMMKKVTLLRRGESLGSLSTQINPKQQETGKPVDDLIMMPKQIRTKGDNTYAGSAFSMSPSPRALPLPSFFNRNEDPATRDLRRLLRLE